MTTLSRVEAATITQRPLGNVEEEAIAHALAGRWEQAAAANAHAISLAPGHVESYNRHAKALIETGRYAEARASVEMALQIKPGHAIAKRHMERLDRLLSAGAVRKLGGASPVARSSSFISDRALSTVTELRNPAHAGILATISPGDTLSLTIEGNRIKVLSADGHTLGNLEIRLAHHLRKLIAGGNRYEATTTKVSHNTVAVMLTEVFRSPGQARLVSFPPALQKYSAVRPEADLDDYRQARPDGNQGASLSGFHDEEEMPSRAEDGSRRLRAILESANSSDGVASEDDTSE
ncbi:MAG: hypothetical protein EXR57_02645 [Dehalococcoidia bacterium]|nr:hypothetical protein [Dehalococcoidia bacterium]MSQ34700.1 hypothetical protein [Dehalococcoidia bacterium]